MQLAPPPPLPVIKIFKYCGVWGGGQNPTKDNGAPLSVIKMLSIVALGKGALAALKTLPKKFQPLLKKISTVRWRLPDIVNYYCLIRFIV